MTEKRNWEERSAEFEVSWINQPYVVEFEVPETPTQRALQRGWKIMSNEERERKPQARTR